MGFSRGCGAGRGTGDGWVVGGDGTGELVGVEPGDEAAVGVVHAVVPAVAVWHRGRLFFVGAALDDFLAGLAGEGMEGDVVFGLAGEGVNEIVNDIFSFEFVRDFVSERGLAVVLDEPGFDVFAGEGGVVGRGGGGRRGCGKWRMIGGLTAPARLEASELGAGLRDDLEALEIGGEEALGGFVELFAGAGTFFVGDDFLRLVEMLHGQAAGFAEALVLQAALEGLAGGGVQGLRSKVQS